MKLITVKILWNTVCTGPIGSVRTVPKDVADDWIERGLAELVTTKTEKTSDKQ